MGKEKKLQDEKRMEGRRLCEGTKSEKEELMVIDFRMVKEILEFEGRNEETINFVHNVLKDAEVEVEK